MPVAHPNFYENLREAQMRLRSTTVCYEGVPYYVIAICGHKPDGIFRMYLVPLDRPQGAAFPATDNYAPDNPLLGGYLDDWLTANPNSGILRKNMDSKHFNKFRPFPLGMCNIGVKTFYLERQPQRNREQGLTRSMLYETAVSTSNRGSNARAPAVTTDIFTAAFKACVLADHPSAQECLEALKDPTVENEAAAFHRTFALVRGPIEMIFLAYKTDIVGILPDNTLSSLKIGKAFKHVREAVEELKLFNTIY